MKNKFESALCDCIDPLCPCATKGHFGFKGKVFRIAMDDTFGVIMCSRCRDDAVESGFFTDLPPNQRKEKN